MCEKLMEDWLRGCVNHDGRNGEVTLPTDKVLEIANYIQATRTGITEQPEQRWIPFAIRPLTEEEKEMYPEWDSILDCELPDDGQRILVSVSVHGHECVQYDEYYADDGCYLDSGYEIGTEAVAWQPLPEPYEEGAEQ